MKRMYMMIVAGLVLAGVMGCSTRAPYGVSWDRHNFVSTEQLPVSLTLVDTVTQDVLWELDVPVGEMAVVDLEHKRDWSTSLHPGSPAYKIKWGVFPESMFLAQLPNSEHLPGNPVLLKVRVRDNAEITPVARPAAASQAPAQAAEPTPVDDLPVELAPAEPAMTQEPAESEQEWQPVEQTEPTATEEPAAQPEPSVEQAEESVPAQPAETEAAPEPSLDDLQLDEPTQVEPGVIAPVQ